MESLVEKKIYSSIFSNPVFVYSVIWIVALVLFPLVEFSFLVDSNPTINGLIIASIISFLLVYLFLKNLLGSNGNTTSSGFDINFDSNLRFYLNFLFSLWLLLFLLTCIIQGGFPLLWLFTGSGKTYADFGLPVLGGFNNMIRNFLGAGFFFMYLMTKNKRYLAFVLILTTLIFCELSRGALMVFLTHLLGIYLLIERKKLKIFVRMGLFFVGLSGIFTILAFVRGAGSDYTDFLLEGAVGYSFFTWPLIYFLSPLNNLYGNFENLSPGYYPNNILEFVIPNKISQLLIDKDIASNDSSNLLNEALNTYPYFYPLISDFGILLAFIIILLMQIFISYVYLKALRGHLGSILMYPPLFMCLALSFFHPYPIELVVIFYPLLVLGLYVKNLRFGISAGLRKLEP